MKNIIISMFLLASLTIADQFSLLSKDEALRSKDLIINSDSLYFYCAPCENDIPELLVVESISISKVKHKWYFGFPSFRRLCDNLENLFQSHYELEINNKSRDLAYIYFYTEDKKWKNVASELNLNPIEVPLYINE